MPDKSVAHQHHATFEGIRHVDDEGNEFWLARPLGKVLDYSEYRHFLPVVERAREACRNSGHPVEDHFEDILEMVEIGSGARRELPDVRLSRYACYLIVQNGDPSKPVIANGQTYFAMQTRRQELADDAKFAQLSEGEKRLAIRNELATHNKHLAAAAKSAGVETTTQSSRITATRGSTVAWATRKSTPARGCRRKSLDGTKQKSTPHARHRIGQIGRRTKDIPRYGQQAGSAVATRQRREREATTQEA
ncbi:DNA damage-inducible protein D [Zoogloea sp. 1C4]|uniref:DNA damage-inducible protein D n=1 Tax=Zoogloea sp. 1C4 TaxID=2570190 RepID=UPI001D16FC48|nr:DNA damage-inducible protein D [Zoogloea sp. 1C4]